MSAVDAIDELLCALADGVLQLKGHFIDPHVGAVEPPEAYVIDVKSFCVLSYASLEHTLESFALLYLEWLRDTAGSDARRDALRAPMLLYHGKKEGYLYGDPTHHDFMGTLQAAFSDACDRFAQHVELGNHGAGRKHLRRLFWPLGIELSTSSRFEASLQKLLRARGAFAHRTLTDRKDLTSPEDALGLVSDGVEFASNIRDELVSRMLGQSVPSWHRQLLMVCLAYAAAKP